MSTSQLHILEKQLDLFRKIQAASESLFQGGDDLTLDAVIDLIDKREPWIESLREYDKQIQELGEKNDEISSQLRLEISQYAKSLAEIDKRIMDMMQEKKRYMLKNMARNIDNNVFIRQKRASDQMKPQFVDIQE
jgi:hypothetical protein